MFKQGPLLVLSTHLLSVEHDMFIELLHTFPIIVRWLKLHIMRSLNAFRIF